MKFGAETYPNIFHVFAWACELVVVAYLKNLTISMSSIWAQNTSDHSFILYRLYSMPFSFIYVILYYTLSLLHCYITSFVCTHTFFVVAKRHNQHLLRGHTSNVSCIALSPKDNVIASGQAKPSTYEVIFVYGPFGFIFPLSFFLSFFFPSFFLSFLSFLSFFLSVFILANKEFQSVCFPFSFHFLLKLGQHFFVCPRFFVVQKLVPASLRCGTFVPS